MILTLNSALTPYKIALFNDAHKALSHCELANHQLSESLFLNLKNMVENFGGVSAIKGIAFAKGPGPFTSLRIGMTSVRTMAQVLNIPIKGFCSLECMVCAYRNFDGLYIASIPAHKGHYHIRLFGVNSCEVQAKSSLLLLSEQQMINFTEKFQQKVYVLGSFNETLLNYFENGPLSLIKDPVIRSRDLNELYYRKKSVSDHWRDASLVYRQN